MKAYLKRTMNQKRKNDHESSLAPKQKIILDTNVFSDLNDKHIGIPLTEYLNDLISRGFDFAFSDISSYELLRGLSIEREQKIIKLLSSYYRYYVTSEILIVSAQLDNLMKMEKIEVNKIDHGDKIIATTAILTGSLLLTANVRDFPWPFFHEVEYRPIFYQDGDKKTKCHAVSLLRPDFDLIKRHFEERP